MGADRGRSRGSVVGGVTLPLCPGTFMQNAQKTVDPGRDLLLDNPENL